MDDQLDMCDPGVLARPASTQKADLFLVASCYYVVVRPGATSSFLLLAAMPRSLVASGY